jgi:aminoglycoside phosphotransferase (APT) family kinase protein
VVPWIDGVAADQCPPLASQAEPFAAFLRSLHGPAPADAPTNRFRGVPLRARAAALAERMQRLASRTSLITPRIRDIGRTALDAPLDLAPTWVHGDLHSRNVLVANGAIAGVIDWGDLTAGDPATDLAATWMLFADPQARQAALAGYPGLTEATVQRARGWALFFGVMLLDTGLADNPRNAAIGEQILRRVAEPF